MKRFWFLMGCVLIVGGWGVSQLSARGFGGGGGGRGGGGFSGGGARPGGGFGGGMPAGGFGGGMSGGFGGGGMPSGGFGGGVSGGGFRPPSASRPSAGGGNFGGGNFGGGDFGGGSRPNLGGGGAGVQRPGVVHMPGSDGGGLQIGGRPQLGGDGGISRPDLRPAVTDSAAAIVPAREEAAFKIAFPTPAIGCRTREPAIARGPAPVVPERRRCPALAEEAAIGLAPAERASEIPIWPAAVIDSAKEAQARASRPTACRNATKSFRISSAI
ncbi:MAG: hypothetical protein QM775_11205 [Pirellulales bacterium]